MFKSRFRSGFCAFGGCHRSALSCTSNPLSVVQVDRVIDGDTVKLDDGSSVRLTGFNAFELKDSGWKRDYAFRAKRRAIEVLPESIKSPVASTKRPYGRLLGNLWMDRAYLSEVLVADGLALTVSVPPENRLTPCLLSIEWSARMARVGIWSLVSYPREQNLIKWWLSSSYWW